MKYMILESELRCDLQKQINSMAREGWRCVNISVSSWMAGYHLHSKYTALMEKSV